MILQLVAGVILFTLPSNDIFPVCAKSAPSSSEESALLRAVIYNTRHVEYWAGPVSVFVDPIQCLFRNSIARALGLDCKHNSQQSDEEESNRFHFVFLFIAFLNTIRIKTCYGTRIIIMVGLGPLFINFFRCSESICAQDYYR